MNVNNAFSSRLLVGAAVVGLVGAAGVFIYEQIYAEKRRAMLVKEVAKLDKQVASMRSELEALRELQKETHARQTKHKKQRREAKHKPTPSGDTVDAVEKEQSYLSDSEYFTDYQSVIGTDAEMESEEFFDVHTDDENDTLRENGLDDRVLDEELSDKTDSPKSSPRNFSTSK